MFSYAKDKVIFNLLILIYRWSRRDPSYMKNIKIVDVETKRLTLFLIMI